MNKIKKLASLILALVMALALAAPAFADDTATKKGKITIDNPVLTGEGIADPSGYRAYKIFDTVYTEPAEGNAPTNFSYTIESTSSWYTAVAAYAAEANNGLTLTSTAASATTFVVSVEDTFSAANFTNALTTALDSMNPKPAGETFTANSDNTISTGDIDLGYYFVTSGQGALCNLTTTDPNVTIHDKNDTPFEKTQNVNVVDGVQIGDVITYTITGKVPATAGFTSYVYNISDTMSEGLTYNSDARIYVGNVTVTDATKENSFSVTGGTEITNNADFVSITNKPDGANSFKAVFDSIKLNANTPSYAGEVITIVYTATVNESAIATIEENKATLEYTKSPATDDEPGTITKETYVYTAKVIIDKYDGASENGETKLSGAEFVLRKEASTSTAENPVYVYYKATTNAEGKVTDVAWIAAGADGAIPADATKLTTDENGAAEFVGLAKGNYQLVETKAPDGYNLLKDPVNVEVTGEGTVGENTESVFVIDELTGKPVEGTVIHNPDTVTAFLAHTHPVENNSGVELPDTGGIGTTIFYVVGGVLAAGAVVLLITKRRMSIDKD